MHTKVVIEVVLFFASSTVGGRPQLNGVSCNLESADTGRKYGAANDTQGDNDNGWRAQNWPHAPKPRARSCSKRAWNLWQQLTGVTADTNKALSSSSISITVDPTSCFRRFTAVHQRDNLADPKNHKKDEIDAGHDEVHRIKPKDLPDVIWFVRRQRRTLCLAILAAAGFVARFNCVFHWIQCHIFVHSRNNDRGVAVRLK